MPAGPSSAGAGWCQRGAGGAEGRADSEKASQQLLPCESAPALLPRLRPGSTLPRKTGRGQRPPPQQGGQAKGRGRALAAGFQGCLTTWSPARKRDPTTPVCSLKTPGKTRIGQSPICSFLKVSTGQGPQAYSPYTHRAPGRYCPRRSKALPPGKVLTSLLHGQSPRPLGKGRQSLPHREQPDRAQRDLRRKTLPRLHRSVTSTNRRLHIPTMSFLS